MSDDDLIIPGRPRKTGGVREIVEVPPGRAPKIKLEPGDLIVVGQVGLRFHEPGPFVILPFERWVHTLNQAIAVAQAALETETEVVSRQVQRAKDRRN